MAEGLFADLALFSLHLNLFKTVIFYSFGQGLMNDAFSSSTVRTADPALGLIVNPRKLEFNPHLPSIFFMSSSERMISHLSTEDEGLRNLRRIETYFFLVMMAALTGEI